MPFDNDVLDQIIDDKNTPETEVVKAVVKQIKLLGDNVKQNYNDLQTRYHALKETLDKKSDAQDEAKAIKFAEEITTRQAALDSQTNGFMDEVNKKLAEFELYLKRSWTSGDDDISIKDKDVEYFIKSVASVRSKDTTEEAIRSGGFNKDHLAKYNKHFVNFLRSPGDERQLSAEAMKALSVGVDPDGGYTVTPAMSNAIITRIYETDPVRQLANVETITTDALEWLVDYDQYDVGWEGETIAGSETDTGKLNKKRIPTNIIYAKPRATQKLIEDSGIDIEAWLSRKIAARMGRFEAASFVTGDGISKPRGFLTYANGTGYGQIEQIASGAAAALTADGIFRLKFGLKEDYIERGTFLMNRSTLLAALLLKDGVGAYLWSPGLTENRYSTLLNSPVRMSTTMPAVAAGALSIAYADWMEAYYIVDRLGITIQRDPYTAKPFVEFYTRKRVGGDVVMYDAIKIQVISV